jgi:hypothetical protein
MKKSSKETIEMRAEYDFSGGVRGKYVARYARGTNVVLLDPELVVAFPDSASVNDALRALLAIANRAAARRRVRSHSKGPNASSGGTTAGDQPRRKSRANSVARGRVTKRRAVRT